METPLDKQPLADSQGGADANMMEVIREGRTVINSGQESFKDKLLGAQSSMNSQNSLEDDLASDDDEPEEVEDKDCPVIQLIRAEKIRVRRPWRQTLIIKVMGRTVGYTYLLRRIKALWHPSFHMELIAIEGGHFLVKFSLAEDYNYVKSMTIISLLKNDTRILIPLRILLKECLFG